MSIFGTLPMLPHLLLLDFCDALGDVVDVELPHVVVHGREVLLQRAGRVSEGHSAETKRGLGTHWI